MKVILILILLLTVSCSTPEMELIEFPDSNDLLNTEANNDGSEMKGSYSWGPPAEINTAVDEGVGIGRIPQAILSQPVLVSPPSGRSVYSNERTIIYRSRVSKLKSLPQRNIN